MSISEPVIHIVDDDPAVRDSLAFVLGAAGGTAATVENLVYLKGLLPQDATWSALGIGAGDIEIAKRGIAEVVGIERVFEYLLDHELGKPIRRERSECIGFGDHALRCGRVHGGCG